MRPKEELKSKYYARNREGILARALEQRRAIGPPKKRGIRLGTTWKNRIKTDYKLPPEKVYIEPIYKRPKQKLANTSRYLRRKQWAVDQLGGKCSSCGYNRCLAALEFDHKDPKEKRWNIADLLIRTWAEEIFLEELKKCDLLCANCHREKTVTCKDIGRGRTSVT